MACNDEAVPPWFSGKIFLESEVRIICFHGAGSDPQVYLSTGNLIKSQPNPLLNYIQSNEFDLLCVHLPGRTKKFNQTNVTSMEEIVDNTYTALQSLKNNKKNIRYVLIGHSMGAWCAFEFANKLKLEGYDVAYLFLSCMISPCSLTRPWKPQKNLNSTEFKNECIAWGINPKALHSSIWEIYEPVLRSDFFIIDSYDFNSFPLRFLYREKLDVPTTLIFAKDDTKIPATEYNINCWKNLLYSETSNNSFSRIIVEGNHNFMQNTEFREHFMLKIVDMLENYM